MALPSRDEASLGVTLTPMDTSASAPPKSPPRLRIPKYEVLEEIGHGGMATVYRAHDPRLGRDVALKVIHPHLRDSAEIAHRFSVEARAVAKLRHRNIVEVYDVSGEDDPEQYLVVELVRGETLRKHLITQGPMCPEVAGALALEILDALEHAHQCAVVHRDIKPENVLIERLTRSDSIAPKSGQSQSPPPRQKVRVKLTDFGIAKLLDSRGVTSTGQVLGSPAHMAPEQIDGGEVDERSDIFSAGVLLYECLVGELPFRGKNPAQVLRRVIEGKYTSAEVECPRVGKNMSRIVDRALAHSPGQRYPSAGAMRAAIIEELTRLRIRAPEDELADWLEDPVAYRQAHGPRIVNVLLEEAGKSRERGDLHSASADLGRALAYDPTNPRLLGMMSKLRNRERSRRALMIAGLCALAFGTAGLSLRALSGRVVARPLGSSEVVDAPSVATSGVPSLPLTVPSSTATESAPPIPPSPTALVSTAPIRSAPAPTVTTARATERRVHIAVRPPEGVLVSVDDSGVTPISGGATSLRLSDARAHTLRFSCVQELCVHETRTVPPGETDASVSVVLTVKPATLFIHGEATAVYQIVERPTLMARAGIPIQLPMKSASEVIHVRQLPSNRQLTATIRAGRTVSVAFRD